MVLLCEDTGRGSCALCMAWQGNSGFKTVLKSNVPVCPVLHIYIWRYYNTVPSVLSCYLLKGAAKCQRNKHILLVTSFVSVLVIEAFELVLNSGKFIYYIRGGALFTSSIYAVFSLTAVMAGVSSWIDSVWSCIGQRTLVRVVLTTFLTSLTLYIWKLLCRELPFMNKHSEAFVIRAIQANEGYHIVI